MPHITIDASSLLAKAIDWPRVLRGVHEEMAAQAWAAMDDMKSRVNVSFATLAGADNTAQQLVATLTMTNPRPEHIQQAMAQALLRHLVQAIESLHPQLWVQCCVFVTEVPRACYLKQQWNPATTSSPSNQP